MRTLKRSNRGAREYRFWFGGLGRIPCGLKSKPSLGGEHALGDQSQFLKGIWKAIVVAWGAPVSASVKVHSKTQ